MNAIDEATGLPIGSPITPARRKGSLLFAACGFMVAGFLAAVVGAAIRAAG